MDLLAESHNFKHFDDVNVYLRKHPEIIYEGKIYSIIKKPINDYIPNSPIIDYFYIKFSPSSYDKILVHGMSILYKGCERIISSIERENSGKITKLYLTSRIFGDNETTCIHIEDVDAVLIWRVAFCIECRRLNSRL